MLESFGCSLYTSLYGICESSEVKKLWENRLENSNKKLFLELPQGPNTPMVKNDNLGKKSILLHSNRTHQTTK